MKKINRKILSLPPYLSTSWKNISSLHIKEGEMPPILVVTLQNGSMIEIPHLDGATIENIFLAHSQWVEQESSETKETTKPSQIQKNSLSFSMGIPFPLKEGEGIDSFTSFLQHNPAQAHAPNLPEEAIEKIRAMTQAMGIDLDQINAPKAEPHCNCMYCQVARAIQNSPEGPSSSKEEEEVTSEDLSFRTWDIKKAGENLYLVTNLLDQTEHYQVFLGNPIGCTCGQKNCEHIRVVLSS